MTLDIIVVYVSACHSPHCFPATSCCPKLPKPRSLPKAGTPWRSQRQPHVVCRCVMYDSMKCDIFMLNYFCKSEKMPKPNRNGTKRNETQSKRELRPKREQESESGWTAAGRGETIELKVSRLLKAQMLQCIKWRPNVALVALVAIEQTIKSFKYCDSIFTVNCTAKSEVQGPKTLASPVARSCQLHL